jgi:hypothetical protein
MQPANLSFLFSLSLSGFIAKKAEYEKEMAENLSAIQTTRARQAAANVIMQQNAGVPALTPGMRPSPGQQQQQNFGPGQMNRMQPSPIAGPLQMSGLNMTDANAQTAMQQSQQQQVPPQNQPQRPIPQPPQARNPFQQQQNPQHAMQHMPHRDAMIGPEDFEQVNQIAEQLLMKASPEDVENVKLMAANMTPDNRQQLARKGIDPVTYIFRSQAVKELRKQKERRIEATRAQGIDLNNTFMVGSDPMPNGINRQMNHNMIPVNPNQGTGHDTNFMGNVENIQGQQADGLRSQKAGQLVVPASNPQLGAPQFPNPQGVFTTQPGQPAANQPAMTPQQQQQRFLAAQQTLAAAHGQVGQVPPTTQFPGQNQIPAQVQAQARAQAANAVKMSQGGSQMSHSPSMSMLNRPVGPQLSPTQAGAPVRPPSRPLDMGPQGAAQPQPGQPVIPPGLPPQLYKQLSQMSPE